MDSSQPCAENTTECLLQRVLAVLEETNNAYNWDPLTLGFTVAIGVIALWFALIPVIDFLRRLVFKPEMLKYNKNAIGPWTAYTRREWIWSELRYSVTVYTPLLELDSLFSCLDDRRHDNPFLSGFVKPVETTKDQDSPTSTWLALLRCLEIEQIVQSGSLKNVPSTVETLPGDFIAVPAYGRVRAITIMAIAAGCHSISVKEGYPFLRGPRMQLEFRPHSSRAVVAVFSDFSSDNLVRSQALGSQDRSIYSRRQLRQMETIWELANGHLRNPDGKRPANSHVYPDQANSPLPEPPELQSTLLYGDVPIDVRLFPVIRLPLNETGKQLSSVYTSFWSSRSDIDDAFSNKNVGCMVDFFPAGQDTLDTISTWTRLTEIREFKGRYPGSYQPSWFYESRGASLPVEPAGHLLILEDAFDLVHLWLNSPKIRRWTQWKDKRSILFFQLTELDRWLSYREKSAAKAIVNDIINTVKGVKSLPSTYFIGSAPQAFRDRRNLLKDLREPHKSNDSLKEPAIETIRFLIHFRALTFAAYLSCATDTSILDELETMDHIVHFI
ncbi:hypothetical protein PVAG01_07569 [Phlyctema vagabunda]|uniref:Uncharacterized protein n=1 Tax=Phlyctema vagabunda TaxID=108571 RepID=A0ABR4PCS4_9HELO